MKPTAHEQLEYKTSDPFSGVIVCRGTVADLVLDAFVIPQCGLIPPFEVMSTVLKSGGGQGGMSPGCSWTPLELTEDTYWDLVDELTSKNPNEFKLRHRDPQIVGELALDTAASQAVDYPAWLESLSRRGLLTHCHPNRTPPRK